MTHREFAKTLVTWRERNNYTQRTAAEMLGVSKRSLENLEQERAMPQGVSLSCNMARDRRLHLHLEALPQ